MKQVIIGREKEKEELQRCMNSSRSEFVIVYGRRRVGKTFLVDNFFNGQFDFTFVGGHRLTSASAWRSIATKDAPEEKGAQIDLVIDRGDHTINLCEMKFSTSQFVISEEYEQHVRERISLFREKTKTSKSLVSTFITTFGVANGMHRSIVGKEVVAKDLFS